MADLLYILAKHEYAEDKGIELVENPFGRRYGMARQKSSTELRTEIAELKEQVTELEDENENLQDQLDQITDIIAPEQGEEEEEEDEDLDDDDDLD